MVGAVISNTLLITGLGFLLGGWNRYQQYFNADAVGEPLHILILSLAAILIPTAITIYGSGTDSLDQKEAILKTSRALSVMLILSYLCYLIFSFKSHHELFMGPQKKGSWRKPVHRPHAARSLAATIGASLSASLGGAVAQEVHFQEPDEEGLPTLSGRALIFTLCIDVALLGVCTSFMVDSVDGLTQKTLLSQSFVGIILLPLLSCNLHAITLAKKDKLQQSFELTINNSVQVLLFILPLAVMIGWMRGDPSMTLLFDGPQVMSLGLAILILKNITQAGESHWYFDDVTSLHT